MELSREECVQVLVLLAVYKDCLERAGLLGASEYAWVGSAVDAFGLRVWEAVRRERDGR